MKHWKKQWLEMALCLSLGIATTTACYKPNWFENGINWVIDNIILFHWSSSPSTPANNGGAYGGGGGDAF
jgi:hypothetical protein